VSLLSTEYVRHASNATRPQPSDVLGDRTWKKVIVASVPIFGLNAGFALVQNLRNEAIQATRLDRNKIKKLVKEYKTCLLVNSLTYGSILLGSSYYWGRGDLFTVGIFKLCLSLVIRLDSDE